MQAIATYRGRTATADDVAFIRSLIETNPQDSRRALSIRLCHAWNWFQPNGQPRDMVCRGLLLMLHRAGHIVLPSPRVISTGRRAATGIRTIQADIDKTPITAAVKQLQPLEIVSVRRTEHERLHDGLIAQHHYLGYTQPVGEHLKYVVFSGGRPVACCTFSSSPRHIGCRDRFIGWDVQTRRANINLIAYNTRFLVLPWVQVKCLASHLLSTIARRICTDWQQMYRHGIYLLETFVDTERFAGTCYKAANWKYLGLTTGRGKADSTHKANRSIKAVWGYPLSDDFKEVLTHVHG
jgi:hypothetical protein